VYVDAKETTPFVTMRPLGSSIIHEEAPSGMDMYEVYTERRKQTSRKAATMPANTLPANGSHAVSAAYWGGLSPCIHAQFTWFRHLLSTSTNTQNVGFTSFTQTKQQNIPLQSLQHANTHTYTPAASNQTIQRWTAASPDAGMMHSMIWSGLKALK
jgi:hypothetical protein